MVINSTENPVDVPTHVPFSPHQVDNVSCMGGDSRTCMLFGALEIEIKIVMPMIVTHVGQIVMPMIVTHVGQIVMPMIVTHVGQIVMPMIVTHVGQIVMPMIVTHAGQ